MHFTTHAAVGAGLGTLIGGAAVPAVGVPAAAALAFGAAVVSHAALDAVPHKDTASIGGALADVAAGTFLALWAMGGFSAGMSVPAFFGFLGGVIPDLEVALVYLGLMGKDRLRFPSHTGVTPHPSLPGIGGLLIQLPFAAAGWAAAIFFR